MCERETLAWPAGPVTLAPTSVVHSVGRNLRRLPPSPVRDLGRLTTHDHTKRSPRYLCTAATIYVFGSGGGILESCDWFDAAPRWTGTKTRIAWVANNPRRGHKCSLIVWFQREIWLSFKHVPLRLPPTSPSFCKNSRPMDRLKIFTSRWILMKE